MDRVFGTLSVKVLDEEQRIVEGIASTPTIDRMGDIVEPLGAEYSLPIPFLIDHDHSEAIGEVELAEVTRAGIRFRARVRKIAEPGLAKDMVDRGWHLLKHGLRKAVSIGFRPLEFDQLPGGGIRFRKWEWFELSAVTVPANAEATVTGVKRTPAERSAQPLKSNEPRRRSHPVIRLSDPLPGRLPIVRLADPVGNRPLPIVKLSDSDKRRGQILARAERHIAVLRKHGVPLPVVKLTAADEVERILDAEREKRRLAKFKVR